MEINDNKIYHGIFYFPIFSFIIFCYYLFCCAIFLQIHPPIFYFFLDHCLSSLKPPFCFCPNSPSHLHVHLLSSPWLRKSLCFMLSWWLGSRLRPYLTRWRWRSPLIIAKGCCSEEKVSLFCLWINPLMVRERFYTHRSVMP